MKRKKNVNKDYGVAAIFIVVVISAASLLMAKSAAMLGLGELELGYTSQKGAEAFSVADGCVEEALRRIKLDTNYGIGMGTINLTVSNGSCSIDIVDLGGNQRRIVVNGNVGSYNKKIQVAISLAGSIISITSWQELST